MARDSGGNMSLAKPPFVDGTASSAPDMNTVLSDIATELTDSLSRSGKGGLLAPLKFLDGALATPAISFTNETGSGWYRVASNIIAWVVAGVERMRATTTGVAITGTLTASGKIDRPSLPTVGQQISASSGSFSTSSTSFVDATNLSVTITTTGRPVLVGLIGDGVAGHIPLCSVTTTVGAYMQFQLLRGATSIGGGQYGIISNGTYPAQGPPPGVLLVDPVAAGTYTYKIQALVSVGTATGYIQNASLFALEL